MRRLGGVLLISTVVMTFAASCSTKDQLTWTRSTEGIRLTVQPSSVPAVQGPVEVTVEVVDVAGQQSDIFIATCSQQHGQVDLPPSGEDPCVPVEGETSWIRVNARRATPFSVPLTVQIDDATIQDGGVTLIAGDIWIPYAGAVLLQVTE